MKTKSRFEEGNVVLVEHQIRPAGLTIERVLVVNKIGAWSKITGYIYELIDYNDLHKEYYDDIELRRQFKVLEVYKDINEALEREDYEE